MFSLITGWVVSALIVASTSSSRFGGDADGNGSLRHLRAAFQGGLVHVGRDDIAVQLFRQCRDAVHRGFGVIHRHG